MDYSFLILALLLFAVALIFLTVWISNLKRCGSGQHAIGDILSVSMKPVRAGHYLLSGQSICSRCQCQFRFFERPGPGLEYWLTQASNKPTSKDATF